jgi:hypothetical protein
MEESISLEETNKIRISLGLKPLTDDGAPTNSKDQEAQDNYANKRKAEDDEKKKRRVKLYSQHNLKLTDLPFILVTSPNGLPSKSHSLVWLCQSLDAILPPQPTKLQLLM